MLYMKIKIKLLIVFVGFLFTTSCNKFLDVIPEDRFLSEDIFQNEIAIQNSLNGIYLNIAKPKLYGENLSMGVLDIMGQYYILDIPNNVGSTTKVKSAWQRYMLYDYTDKSVQEKFSVIWEESYTAILNVNTFIDGLSTAKGVVTDDRKDILLGEAYGLRAFLHFDMLRLFGPIDINSSTQISIPYLEKATEAIQPILSAQEVTKKIIADLDKAENLLSNDPIVGDGVNANFENDPRNDFYKLRNRRLNYYALLALKSRVYLYMGDKENAFKYSVKVIEESSDKFLWVDPSLADPANRNPDKIFSSEVLFGVHNTEMYNSQRTLFTSIGMGSSYFLIQESDDVLRAMYGNNENDYRFKLNFLISSPNNGGFTAFIKYEDVNDKSLIRRNFQPLLRISECYLIAAESSSSKEIAKGYLNEIRRNRGGTPLPNEFDLEREIQREYQKEFWGEGQFFFYNKRKSLTSVLSGRGANVSVSLNQYVVPLPEVELQNR